MKKTILKALVVTSVVLASSAAFAANLSPGTVYSLGSTNPSSFRTSPKVTLNTSLSSGTAATEWGAITVHASAIDKAKGYAYYTNSNDPGTYTMSTPTTSATTSATVSATTVPTSFAAEK